MRILLGPTENHPRQVEEEKILQQYAKILESRNNDLYITFDCMSKFHLQNLEKINRVGEKKSSTWREWASIESINQ